MPKKKKTEEKDKPKIWMPELVKISRIDIDMENTNKQDRATFEGLAENIELEGFDENVILIPKPDGRLRPVAGNHRVLAAQKAGLDEVPAVIRDDWDEVKAAVQGVRRNVARGDVDKAAFTNLVNKLHTDHQVDFSDIQSQMGIHDAEEFASFYEAEKRKEERTMDRIENENAPAIKMMDDITAVVNHIFEQYGDTVPYSFLCFPMGGKGHLFVSSTNALKTVLAKVVVRCKESGMDLPTALTGLLHIGISSSEFMKQDTTKSMDSLEKELTVDEEDADLML